MNFCTQVTLSPIGNKLLYILKEQRNYIFYNFFPLKSYLHKIFSLTLITVYKLIKYLFSCYRDRDLSVQRIFIPYPKISSFKISLMISLRCQPYVVFFNKRNLRFRFFEIKLNMYWTLKCMLILLRCQRNLQERQHVVG